MSTRLKWLVTLWGVILLLPGLLALLGYCLMMTVMLLEGDAEALTWGIGLAVFLTVTLGGGGVTVYQGLRALGKQPSRPLRLPPLWAVGGGFALALAIGLGLQQVEICAPLLFPLCLMVAALAPPLAAVVWMLDHKPGTLTWRRVGVAFVAGATVSVVLAIILEVLLPGVVLLLVLDLAEPVLDGFEELFDALAGREVAKVLTSPGFLFALVELAVVAPLVEETVKPLVTLPLLRHLERPRDALLLGAAAGAGFAVLENVLYATVGLPIWAGVLAVRALGAAVHPVGSGLVTLGWHGLLRRRPDACPEHGRRGGRRWLGGYGLAIGIHALWNGGITLLLALAGAQFFGEMPPEVDVLGATVAGSLLALLAVEGVAVFVGARTLARRLAIPEEGEAEEAPALSRLPPDQAMAVWALVCLLALLPVGLAVLEAVW
jgi:RsiW-degrading membrane proteinase PrsW (M82 family)